MDVLKKDSGISPQKWQIRTNIDTEGRSADRAPARFGTGCQLKNCMISAGSHIQGTVINSVLAPGVVVEEGAVVKDSILFEDCIVGKGAKVDLAILDKRVQVGENAIVGCGDNHTCANKRKPSHLYTGITLVGKEARVPAEQQIGRNCIIDSGVTESCFREKTLGDGESLLNKDEL